MPGTSKSRDDLIGVPDIQKELWLKNDSEIPLYLVEFGYERLEDSVTGEYLGSYQVKLANGVNPIDVDQVREIQITLYPYDDPVGHPFALIIGAIGQTQTGDTPAGAIGFLLQKSQKEEATKNGE